jgi:hypothetical protein
VWPRESIDLVEATGVVRTVNIMHSRSCDVPPPACAPPAVQPVATWPLLWCRCVMRLPQRIAAKRSCYPPTSVIGIPRTPIGPRRNVIASHNGGNPQDRGKATYIAFTAQVNAPRIVCSVARGYVVAMTAIGVIGRDLGELHKHCTPHCAPVPQCQPLPPTALLTPSRTSPWLTART